MKSGFDPQVQIERTEPGATPVLLRSSSVRYAPSATPQIRPRRDIARYISIFAQIDCTGIGDKGSSLVQR